ncbi:protein of unknown function [Candidatus Filomicrobium marinum]|nr:protein of unknown function [Candidatus Filomicrobium marinum]
MRWPYQANVMKILEIVRSRIGATLAGMAMLDMGAPGEMKTDAATACLGVSAAAASFFTISGGGCRLISAALPGLARISNQRGPLVPRLLWPFGDDALNRIR